MLVLKFIHLCIFSIKVIQSSELGNSSFLYLLLSSSLNYLIVYIYMLVSVS